MSVYSFREGPSYTAATREEMFTAAMDLPMNFGATFWDQAKGGTLESFGLGTAIRGAAIPPGDTSQLSTMEQIGRTAQSVMPGGVVATIGGAIRRLTDEPSPVLSEDAYKASPFFREDVPWDASMTEDRAAALASWHDAKVVRQYFATKRPITAFIGNVAGQAADPINYIPVVGPAVQAAAAARAGRVFGTAATASADAALNTAIAGMATAGQRAQFGDDVSWPATITEIATAALIGAAFGGIAGGIDARRAAGVDAAVRERLSTLQTAQEARIALNEGIDALAKGEDINLSPNATAGVERVSRQAPATQVDTSIHARAPSDETAYLSTRELSRSYNRQYVDDDGNVVASSRSVPSEAAIPPVGSWRMADWKGNYGREIERLDALAIDDLVLPELRDGELDVAKKGDDQTYASWVREGREPPPIEVIRTEDGKLKVTDGHRRVLAAKVTGQTTIKGWVSELAPTGKTASDGKPIQTSLTYELAQKMDGPAPIRPVSQPIDTSPPHPEPIPAGRAEAEKSLTRTDDYAAMKAQYRVDPETGDFLESAEIDQLRAEGRLTDEDIAALDAAQAELDNGTAYGDALKAAVACII